MTIYYLCPESPHPIGGVKVIYRHVDILNQNGFSAYVLHEHIGFRCDWFENSTQIAYAKDPRSLSFMDRAKKKVFAKSPPRIPVKNSQSKFITEGDILVFPEMYGPEIANMAPGIKKVILNQNGFLTFKGYSFNKDRNVTPYTSSEVVAVLVNSEHSKEYMEFAFPGIKTHHFILSIDPAIFHYQAKKKRQICFSQIKNTSEAMQVINILKFRKSLRDFDIVPFINLSEKEVGSTLRDSLIFLSVGNREGFGLPPAEAMACGCIAVGYHGWGGKEFFNKEFSSPIEDGDIIGIVKAIEEVIERSYSDPDTLEERGRKASQFIHKTYSPRNEEEILVNAWRNIIPDHQ